MSLIPCSKCGKPLSTNVFSGRYLPSQDKWICQPCIDELDDLLNRVLAESTYTEPQ